jgi:hydrogenase/urease accessory protein HupE
LRWRAAGTAILAGVLAVAPAGVAAHPANVAHARIAIEERAVEIALSMNLLELDLVLSLDRDLDGRVDARELEARRTDVLDYLRSKVGVSAAGLELPAELRTLAVGRSGDGRAVVETTLVFRSERPLRDIGIRCEPLTELGADHTTLARIDAHGSRREFAFRSGVTYAETAGALATALEFLKLGIVHIFIGYDHIAFLLALLLAGASSLAVVKIVTAFTAAHSITLSLAVLDVVTLNPALVEIGIALSIVYVAAENLFTRKPGGRWLVGFLFGLVHGFGFAAVLRELTLPSSALVASLVSFNVGVEIAQVAIVAVVVPALYGLTRTRVHAPLMRMASVVILSLGLFWLYQRALS